MRIELKDASEFQKTIILKGFSQRSFARELNLSPPYVNQIINTKRYPSSKVAKQITEILDVDFNELFIIKEVCKS